MNPARLLKAISFAADKHRHQRRKDAEASPYINHPIAVATVLAAEGDVSDEVTLIAAALHDTVEDTQTTFGELEEHFGSEVASLVRELTDDKSLEKAERKRLQIEHARNSSIRAKQLKIADKICNVRDITDTLQQIGRSASTRLFDMERTGSRRLSRCKCQARSRVRSSYHPS